MEELTIDRQGSFRYAFDRHDEAVMSIESGERIVVETANAYHGQIVKEGHRDRDTEPRSNPLSGPIAVSGAQPGDTLAVSVEQIRPRGPASTYVPSWWWFLGSPATRRAMDEFTGTQRPDEAVELPVEDDSIRLSDERSIPFEPMIGTLGTAPDGPPIPNAQVGPHGGNMDLPCLAPGSTAYLPVSVEGGNLYVGDAHAAQGDAEVLGVGAELPAEITLQVDLISGHELAWPRIETDERLYAVGGKTAYADFPSVLRLAFVLLAQWLVERGMEKWEAWRLCGLQAEVLVGNFQSVAVSIQKELLE